MGVWQMIENEQPILGQWDAVMDTNWDGCKWVPHDEYMDSLVLNRVISSMRPAMLWSGVKAAYENLGYFCADDEVNKSPAQQEPPTNKADAAWSALESMF